MKIIGRLILTVTLCVLAVIILKSLGLEDIPLLLQCFLGACCAIVSDTLGSLIEDWIDGVF